MFGTKTIDATDRSYDNGESGDKHVRFVGTDDTKAFSSKDYSILLMGGENTLYYPASGAGIGAQRAYLKIGDEGAANVRPLTAFDISFGDDNTTGIISISTEDSSSANGWYTIDGRRLSGKPTASGVYVNSGRKVLIK